MREVVVDDGSGDERGERAAAESGVEGSESDSGGVDVGVGVVKGDSGGEWYGTGLRALEAGSPPGLACSGGRGCGPGVVALSSSASAMGARGDMPASSAARAASCRERELEGGR